METLKDIFKFLSKTDKRLLVSFNFSGCNFCFPTYRTETLKPMNQGVLNCQLSIGEKPVQVMFLCVRNRHDWRVERHPGLNIYNILSLFMQQVPNLCQPDVVSDPLRVKMLSSAERPLWHEINFQYFHFSECMGEKTQESPYNDPSFTMNIEHVT